MDISIGTLFSQNFPAPNSVQSETATFTVGSTTSVKIKMKQLGPIDKGGNFIGNIVLARIVPSSFLIENGSSDACGITSISASQTTFNCNDIGANTVALTVADNNGNSYICSAIVTVIDSISPIASAQGITLYLDNSGNANLTAAQIDNGSSDNCGIDSIYVNNSSFDCSDVGANTVTLTVVDNSGNRSSETATITVIDSTAPLASTQNVSIFLDGSGSASIIADDVNNGSDDVCGIVNTSIDINTFDCSNAGANTVMLTVTDANGNASSAPATVTVIDSTSPAVSVQNLNIYLDASGNASITAADADNGSSDNCAIDMMSIDVNSAIVPMLESIQWSLLQLTRTETVLLLLLPLQLLTARLLLLLFKT